LSAFASLVMFARVSRLTKFVAFPQKSELWRSIGGAAPAAPENVMPSVPFVINVFTTRAPALSVDSQIPVVLRSIVQLTTVATTRPTSIG